MKQKKHFINAFDISVLLIVAAVIILLAVFVSPSGKTVTVGYTLTVTDDNTAEFSEGDVLTVISGGTLGTVSALKENGIEAYAEAELHAGQYYIGAVPLKEGGEYVVCVGADRFVCTLGGISER